MPLPHRMGDDAGRIDGSRVLRSRRIRKQAMNRAINVPPHMELRHRVLTLAGPGNAVMIALSDVMDLQQGLKRPAKGASRPPSLP